MRPPSGFVMTTGLSPSMTATTELVVPRSMPMILLTRGLLTATDKGGNTYGLT